MKNPQNAPLSRMRNKALLDATLKVLSNSRQRVANLAEASAVAAGAKAPNYYVSYSYARRMLGRIRTNPDELARMKAPNTRALWTALDSEVRRIEKKYRLPIGPALVHTLCVSPAPSFFLSPHTALRIVASMRKPANYHRKPRRKRTHAK